MPKKFKAYMKSLFIKVFNKNFYTTTLATSIVMILLLNMILPFATYAVPNPNPYDEELSVNEEEDNPTEQNEEDTNDQNTEEPPQEENTDEETSGNNEENTNEDEQKPPEENKEQKDENKTEVKEIWLKNNTNNFETTDNVTLNTEYILSEFNNLTIIFTKLPEKSGKIFIEKIQIGAKIDESQIIGDAYNITSDMVDSEFEYTIRIPKPEEYASENLEIKYSEDGVNFIDLTDEKNEGNFVTAEKLNHLTTFIVVRNPSPPPTSYLEMIIDNTDPEFSIIENPNWVEETIIPGFYGSNYRILRNELGSVQYLFQVLDNGNYDVFAWYPSDPTLGTANYNVNGSPIAVNQAQSGGQWNLLDPDPANLNINNFYFQTGVNYYIEITNPNSQIVVADAVKIQSTEAPNDVWADDGWIDDINNPGAPEGENRYYGYNAFTTIQEAIDAVRPDGIVHVLAGTYEEQIDIQKNITLEGEVDNENRKLVTINSPVSLVSKWGTNRYPIIYVTGANNVIIDNLTINGSGRGNNNYRFYGVVFRNAGGTIQNTNVTDIREEPLNNVEHGIAIYITTLDDILRDINITNNQILNYQKGGIVISNSINYSILNNIIIGYGNNSLVSQNGIQIQSEATGTISGNLIRSNLFEGSSGILFYITESYSTVTDNEIFNNYVGIYNWGIQNTPLISNHNYLHNNNYNAVDDRSDSAWDDGTEGNRWDDYYGVDLDGDGTILGVGDTQIPYIIRNQNGDPSPQDNYPLTYNFLTTPSRVTPLNGGYCNTQTCPIIDWADSNGTYPAFTYRIQGFSDAGYTNPSILWDPGWISATEISTLNIPNQPLYIRVQSQDARGNISYWSNGASNPYLITIDNSPPETQNPLISPLSDSYWNAPIEISSISTEILGGIDYVNISFRNSGTGDPWTLITKLDPTDNPPVYVWPDIIGPNNPIDTDGTWESWTPGSEGTYDIRAQAVDTAGNIESSGYAYYVAWDRTAPVVDITNPLNNAVVGKTIIIEGNINEAYLDYYELTIDSTYIGSGTTNIVSHDFDTTTLAEGIHTITLTAYDRVRPEPNSAQDSINITIDHTAPVSVMIVPTDDFRTNNPIVIAGYSTDLHTVDFVEILFRQAGTSNPWTISIITSYNTTTANPFNWDCAWIPANDGVYDILVRATDTVGNLETREVDENISYNVLYDTTPPVTTITSPEVNSPWNRSITISGNSTDPSVVSYIDLAFRPRGSAGWTNITRIQNTDNLEPFSWTTVNPLWIPPYEGYFEIQVSSTDTLGNTGVVYTAVLYDITPPTTTIESPESGLYSNIPIYIEGLSLDNFFVEYYTLSYRTAGSADPWTEIITWPNPGDTIFPWHEYWTPDFDGTYDIFAQSFDSAGNFDNGVIVTNITYDTLPPVVQITYPPQWYYLRQTVDIHGTVQDIHLYSYQLTIENINTGELTDCGVVYTSNSVTDISICNWNTITDPLNPSANDGDYIINLSATDRANNTSNTSITVHVDNTIPIVEITSPENDDKVRGEISIMGKIKEVNLDLLNYALSISPSGTIEQEQCTLTYITSPEPPDYYNYELTCNFDTNSVDNGLYTLSLTATDLAGNISETSSIEITIDNSKPLVEEENKLKDMIYNEGDTITVNIIGNDDISLSQLCFQIEEISDEYNCELGSGVEYTWNLDLTKIYTALLQDGVYTINYYLNDSSGNESDDDDLENGDQNYTAKITVNNVAPQVIFNQNQTITEGEEAVFTASFTDPSYIEGSGNTPDDAPWTVTLNYGDGSAVAIWTVNMKPGNLTIPNHVYKYNGVYTATLTVTESNLNKGDGQSTTKTVVVTVQDNKPLITLFASPSNYVYAWVKVSLSSEISKGNAPFSYKWSGACAGTQSSTELAAPVGVYLCKLTVTDSDGDVSENSIRITVVLKPNVEENQTTTNDEESNKEEETDKNNDILGFQICNIKSKVSGYVFVDNNRDNKRDEDEKGLPEITVEIYAGLESANQKIASAVTNDKGYWEIELCPGDFSLTLNIESLPKNSELEWGNFIFISVKENENITDINFPVISHESFWDKFDIKLCTLPLIVLLGLGLYLTIKSRKDKSKENKNGN